jgi:hypothetical protein
MKKVVKGKTLASFPLKKPPQISVMTPVIRVVQNLFHRPALRLAVIEDARGICRNPRFASFLVASNRKALDTHFSASLARGRRSLRVAALVFAASGATWLVLESARALSVF